MSTDATELVDAEDLRRLAQTYLERSGVAAAPAELVAGTLVDADVRGHPSHGVELLPLYATRIRAGGIDPSAQPTIKRIGDVSFAVDAHGGLGQLAMSEASRLAADEAAAHGASTVSVANNNHVGMLAAYRHPFVERGVAGLIFNVSGPSGAPPGGARATIGNNALCCIAPTDDPSAPFIVDLATGTVACGKIRVAATRGEPIPDGWLVDRQGQPTVDPAELDAGGAVPVFGGYKGLAISAIVEVMAGILGGATVSPLVNRQRHAPDHVMRCSQLIIGTRVPGAVGAGGVARLVSLLSGAVDDAYTGAPPATTFPEQRERDATERAAKDGVPVSRVVLEELRAG